jgi:hypothetical protein
MKFLLIGKDIGFTTPVAPGQLAGLLEGVYIPSFKMLEKWESEKKVTGGFLAAQRGAPSSWKRRRRRSSRAR